MTSFVGRITNWIYLTPLHRRRFQARHPDETVIIASATKGRITPRKTAEVRYEAGWITSRRGTLILTDRRLVLDDWSIPLEQIHHAEMVQFGTGLVLKLSTDTQHYQFGLQSDQAWYEQQALAFSVVEQPVAYSRFSIILRIIVLASLALYAFWFLQRILS